MRNWYYFNRTLCFEIARLIAVLGFIGTVALCRFISQSRLFKYVGRIMAVELVVSVLVVAGAGFVLISAIGLVRLPDFFSRLYLPTKASTLGAGCLLLASLLHFSSHSSGLSLHELLILIFLFLTAPISAQLLAKIRLPHEADNL